MQRKLYRGIICLQDPSRLPDKVSIFQNGKGVVIMPYQDGDEKKKNRKIKEFDSRGRLIIPHKMLKKVGISDCAEIVRRSDGAVMLLPVQNAE